MQKVVYSVTRVMKEDNLKVKGVGYISDTDLLILAISKDNNPYIRVFEDCIKYCHQINNSDAYKGTYYEMDEYEGHDYQRTFYIWYKLLA
ncbi:MAG: hypothetical protein E7338_02000 [Clostridiales bacterium]|nr:hypothetical protein [Clostridiales bacterium]